jgi:hypothetical protein
MKCTHYECRCQRAVELSAMAERTGRTDLLVAAIGVHEQEVECRRPGWMVRDELDRIANMNIVS